nr:hypothetical protein CJ188_07950 [Actinomyces sp. UMB0918]
MCPFEVLSQFFAGNSANEFYGQVRLFGSASQSGEVGAAANKTQADVFALALQDSQRVEGGS